MESIYKASCPGTCNVTGPGSPAYDNAWFEINYVRAFTTGAPVPTSSAAPTSTATVIATVTGTGSPGATTTGTNRTGSNGAVDSLPRATSTGLMAMLFSMFAGVLLATW